MEYVVAFGTLLWAAHAAYVESVQSVLKPLQFYRSKYEQLTKFIDRHAALQPDLFTKVRGDDVISPEVLLDRVRDDELHRAFTESDAAVLRLENLQRTMHEHVRDIVHNPVRHRAVGKSTYNNADKTVHV